MHATFHHELLPLTTALMVAEAAPCYAALGQSDWVLAEAARAGVDLWSFIGREERTVQCRAAIDQSTVPPPICPEGLLRFPYPAWALARLEQSLSARQPDRFVSEADEGAVLDLIRLMDIHGMAAVATLEQLQARVRDPGRAFFELGAYEQAAQRWTGKPTVLDAELARLNLSAVEDKARQLREPAYEGVVAWLRGDADKFAAIWAGPEAPRTLGLLDVDSWRLLGQVVAALRPTCANFKVACDRCLAAISARSDVLVRRAFEKLPVSLKAAAREVEEVSLLSDMADTLELKRARIGRNAVMEARMSNCLHARLASTEGSPETLFKRLLLDQLVFDQLSLAGDWLRLVEENRTGGFPVIAEVSCTVFDSLLQHDQAWQNTVVEWRKAVTAIAAGGQADPRARAMFNCPKAGALDAAMTLAWVDALLQDPRQYPAALAKCLECEKPDLQLALRALRLVHDNVPLPSPGSKPWDDPAANWPGWRLVLGQLATRYGSNQGCLALLQRLARADPQTIFWAVSPVMLLDSPVMRHLQEFATCIGQPQATWKPEFGELFVPWRKPSPEHAEAEQDEAKASADRGERMESAERLPKPLDTGEPVVKITSASGAIVLFRLCPDDKGKARALGAFLSAADIGFKIPLSLVIPGFALELWTKKQSLETLIRGLRGREQSKAEEAARKKAQQDKKEKAGAKPVPLLPDPVFRSDLVKGEFRPTDVADWILMNSLTAERWLRRRAEFARSLAGTALAARVALVPAAYPTGFFISEGPCSVDVDTRGAFTRTAAPVPFRLTPMLVNALEPIARERGALTTALVAGLGKAAKLAATLSEALLWFAIPDARDPNRGIDLGPAAEGLRGLGPPAQVADAVRKLIADAENPESNRRMPRDARGDWRPDW
jgi:hypothetical protein